MGPDMKPDGLGRDRALRRLSRVTAATAVAGTLAAAGFGGLAALTYRGTSDAATSVVDESGAGSSASPVAPAATPSGSTTSPAAVQPTTPPAASRGSSHARTGGSG